MLQAAAVIYRVMLQENAVGGVSVAETLSSVCSRYSKVQ